MPQCRSPVSAETGQEGKEVLHKRPWPPHLSPARRVNTTVTPKVSPRPAAPTYHEETADGSAATFPVLRGLGRQK